MRVCRVPFSLPPILSIHKKTFKKAKLTSQFAYLVGPTYYMTYNFTDNDWF